MSRAGGGIGEWGTDVVCGVAWDRYNASPPFQDLMWHLTAFWTLGTLIYFGIISAVVWTTTFGFAFGCVLGILFIFLTAWSGLSLVIVKWWGRKELRWWEEVERAHGRVEARGVAEKMARGREREGSVGSEQILEGQGGGSVGAAGVGKEDARQEAVVEPERAVLRE